MNYLIEKNVPLPTPRRGPGQSTNPGVKAKYPFRKMKVGDSFVMDKAHPQASGCVSGAAIRIGGGVQFACRKIDANSTRIWRVK